MPVFGPAPSEYMNRYLNCSVTFADNSVATVAVHKYLSASDTTDPRTMRGNRAYNDLVEALARKTGTPKYENFYTVNGRRLSTRNFKLPFVGQGSPFDVRQAIYAASWCGFVDPRNAQEYCDQNMGLDCIGFAANFFRLDKSNTSVESFDDVTRRLSNIEEMGRRSVLLWVNSSGVGKTHTHVAVGESIERIHRNEVYFQIVHSDGGETNGLRQKRVIKVYARDRDGHVFFSSENDTAGENDLKRIYILPPPNNGIPHD